jgi:hypothetical protein
MSQACAVFSLVSWGFEGNRDLPQLRGEAILFRAPTRLTFRVAP